MPLPFLRHKHEASVAATPEVVKRESDHEEEYDSLESAADDLISAVHAKDSKGVASAMRAAFEIMDSEPHEEGEHV